MAATTETITKTHNIKIVSRGTHKLIHELVKTFNEGLPDKKKLTKIFPGESNLYEILHYIGKVDPKLTAKCRTYSLRLLLDENMDIVENTQDQEYISDFFKALAE